MDWSRSVQGNANTFAIRNLNQFQVSPFASPDLSGLATQTEITYLSSIISTCCGQISTIINPTTYSLAISTIVPIDNALDPSQTVNITADTLELYGNSVDIYADTDLTITGSALEINGDSVDINADTALTITSPQITMSTNSSTPIVIGNDLIVVGCATFNGCVSTISTNLTLDSNVWGKYLFVNKAEQALTFTLNDLPTSGTQLTIKNIASTVGAGTYVTINIASYGDMPSYTIPSFSTLRLMSMPTGWYSL